MLSFRSRFVLISDDEEEKPGPAQLIDLNPPRGARDFPPEEMRLRNWLFQNFGEVSGILSFEEVDFRGFIHQESWRGDHTAEVLGSDAEAVADLRKLFSLAEQYGYSQWINFDASVVRGLAYYTGIVFEAFDREGKLRAICDGGRYDRLLSTFGSDDIPACGFGFEDAVIVEENNNWQCAHMHRMRCPLLEDQSEADDGSSTTHSARR